MARKLNFSKKLAILLVAFSLVPSSSDAQSAAAAKSVYVRSQNAYVWTQPGYTWRDCDKFSPNPILKNKVSDFTNMEQLMAAQQVCAGRLPSLTEPASVGDKIFLQPDGKGGLKFVERDVLVGDTLEKRKFYEVVYDQHDENGKPVIENGQQKSFRGWMPEENLTQIYDENQPQEEPWPTPLDETPEPTPSKPADQKPLPKPLPEPPCPPERQGKPGAKNEAVEAQRIAKRAQEIVEANLGPQQVAAADKTPKQINRFACLYRDASINNGAFPAHLAKVSAAAAKASSAFNIPYSTIMCTLLIESGMSYKPKDRDAYQGMGQFGSDMVTDLQGIAKRKPYSTSLASYKAAFPRTNLTNSNIRKASDDPTHVVAATAMTMKWIHNERLTDPKHGKCRDCTPNNPDVTRKELYLMIGGYNYGPYSIRRYSDQSVAQLKDNKTPPPEETRNYMIQMDRCMQKGQEKQFRISSRPISREYNDRKTFCDAAYPN